MVVQDLLRRRGFEMGHLSAGVNPIKAISRRAQNLMTDRMSEQVPLRDLPKLLATPGDVKIQLTLAGRR